MPVLFVGRLENAFGAADQPFVRLTTPVYNDAEPITPALPVGHPGPTSYVQTSGSVIDSEPRVISNLIVDQTSTNPGDALLLGEGIVAFRIRAADSS